MRYAPTGYAIPAFPPDEFLAELDGAVRVLDALSVRAAVLTLEMDADSGGLRIQLADEGGACALTPTQLFALLASSDV